MTFDPREFAPSPSPWFSINMEYEGWGRAEFSNPEGSIEGPVSVRFDELGEASIDMTVDPSTLQSEQELRFGLGEFLSGEQPALVDDTWVLSTTLASRNPCRKLEVEGPQGVFSTQEVVDYFTNIHYGDTAEVGVPDANIRVPLVRVHRRQYPRAKILGTPPNKFHIRLQVVRTGRTRPPHFACFPDA